MRSVTPRAAATRHDQTADGFLRAAAELIDAALSVDTASLPPRLRSIRFPAALEWMRIEDVIRVTRAQDQAGSKKAFTNRWPTRDEFIRDALVYAILYRDWPSNATPETTPKTLLGDVYTTSLSTDVLRTADAILESLLSHPRSYLLMHVGPMLPRHPEIHTLFTEDARHLQDRWASGFLELILRLGCTLRPEWTTEKMTVALHMMLDGYLLRYRIDPERLRAARWESASLFAQMVVTFVAGCLNTSDQPLTAADWLDTLTAGV